MGADQKPVEPKRAADARERPYVLWAVIAIGAAAPILGAFVGPTAFCSGERGGGDSSSRTLCGAISIILYAPLTALVAGCLAGALGPTWVRFLGGLGGLVVGSLVTIDAWGRELGANPGENLVVVLAIVTPVFVIGYGIVGALRVLSARTRARPRSATHDSSIDWIG